MMSMKYPIVTALAVTTLAANAAITVTNVTQIGSVLSVSIKGVLDKADIGGAETDIGTRNMFVFADKDLGGVQSTPQSQYGGLISGEVLDSVNHGLSGTVGGLDVGTMVTGQPSASGLLSTTYAIGVRGIDGSDNILIRGQGANYDRIDYLAAGLGAGFAGKLNTIDLIDLTFTFELASEADALLYNTPQKFVADWGLFAQDGNVNTGINATVNNYNVLTAIPEPSSTALLGLGGLALILRRRK